MDNWQDYANCKSVDTKVFYPTRGESQAEAEAICNLCEVKMECLKYAIQTFQLYGVWGGLSERKRRAIRRAIRKGYIVEGLEDVVLPPLNQYM